MPFTKYQKVEKTDVVSPAGHDAISDELRKSSKSSMTNADLEERQKIADRLKEIDEQ